MECVLTNEVVLSHLFPFLALKELGTCKLVCKTWNFHANVRIKNEKMLEFYGHAWEDANKFLMDMSSTLDLPFAKFRLLQILDGESFRSRFPSLRSETERFLNFCGPDIRHLHLSFNEFLDTMKMDAFRPWFLASLPNLQTLELTCLAKIPFNELIFPEGFNSDSPIFPNLKKLIIHDVRSDDADGSEGVDDTTNLFQDLMRMPKRLETFVLSTKSFGNSVSILTTTILKALNQPPYMYLTNLHLQCLVNEEVLRILNSFKEPLQLISLELKLIQGDVQKSTLEKLLHSQRKTLRKLVLGEHAPIPTIPGDQPHPAIENTFILEFPYLESLTSLTLIRPCPTRKLTLCQNVFKNCLPKLVKLELSVVISNLDSFLPTNFGESKTLRTLVLPEAFSDPNLMEIILTNFPNLKSLILSIPGDEILKVVWRMGNRLEELELWDIHNLQCDSLFTGIHPKICDWICEEKTYFRVNENFFQVVQRSESLANLTKLRRLNLYFERYSEPITDTTGYLTISNLTELTSLTICGCEISGECQQYIRSKCPIIHLEVYN